MGAQQGGGGHIRLSAPFARAATPPALLCFADDQNAFHGLILRHYITNTDTGAAGFPIDAPRILVFVSCAGWPSSFTSLQFTGQCHLVNALQYYG